MANLDFDTARHNMIEQQIRPWDVLDQQVLDLIANTPREDFVPDAYRTLAFQDIEIPLGHGETMLAPKIEAKLLQALRILPDHRVLEIGTGSGYLTALLARSAHRGSVLSIDLHNDFTAEAANRLSAASIRNVTLDNGNAASGWAGQERFDIVVVGGSVPELNSGLKENLKVGGRMFVVVGDAPVMEATLVTRVSEREWRLEVLFETVLPALQHAPRTQRFVL